MSSLDHTLQINIAEMHCQNHSPPQPQLTTAPQPFYYNTTSSMFFQRQLCYIVLSLYCSYFNVYILCRMGKPLDIRYIMPHLAITRAGMKLCLPTVSCPSKYTSVVNSPIVLLSPLQYFAYPPFTCSPLTSPPHFSAPPQRSPTKTNTRRV